MESEEKENVRKWGTFHIKKIGNSLNCGTKLLVIKIQAISIRRGGNLIIFLSFLNGAVETGQ
jgi:hypothetical protein